MNCYTHLQQSYEKLGNFNALYYMGSKLKSHKFLSHIDAMANYFTDLGIGKKDCYTIYLPTTINSFVIFYALNKIGAIANIVHPLTPLTALKKIIKNTKSKGIIVLDILITDNIEQLNELNLPIMVIKNSDYITGIKKPFFKLYEYYKTNGNKKLINKTYYKKALNKYLHTPATSLSSNKNAIATYLHSGGTSGESKTIMLSNKAIIALSDGLLDFSIPANNKFNLIVLPMFHAYGLAASMHSALTQGYRNIIFPKFVPKTVNKSIRRYDVQTIIGVPLMFSKMLEEKHFNGKHLRKLKTVYCGGDTVTQALQDKFNATIKKYGGSAKILAGYGLTETSSVCTVNTLNNYKPGTVGKPMRNIKLEIWNDNKKPVKPNTIGEIVVAGDIIMNGYFNSEDSGILEKDGEKWVLTGDLGFLDKDNYLTIVGRKKRLIKIAAFNVFPSQIESTVQELSFVRDVCAIESFKENKKIIKLVLSLHNTQLTNEQVASKIFEHCNTNLYKHALPTELEIINELPRTKMGKIDFVTISNQFN